MGEQFDPYKDDILPKVVRDKIEKLYPHYNELSVALMALSFLLSLILEPELRASLDRVGVDSQGNLDPLFVITVLMAFVISIGEALIKHQKTPVEKMFMLGTAVLLTFFVGWVSGAVAIFELYDEDKFPFILALFPLWNMICGFALICSWVVGGLSYKSIEDSDASITSAVSGILLVVVMLLILNYVLEYHWAINLSIALAVSSSFGNLYCGSNKPIANEF